MYSDLELLIRRRDEDSYAVDIRFSAPGQDTDERPLSGDDGTIQIPLDTIRELDAPHASQTSYGVALSEAVFTGKVKEQFQLLRAASERAGGSGMRVRLLIDSSAKELHNLHWETLVDPDGSGKSLCMNERIAFSRYLSSTDPRAVRSRPRGKLDALIAIANPSNISSYEGLAAIDVATELASARTALGSTIAIDTLIEPGKVTLTNLLAGIRKGCDILYLICHGSLTARGEPQLYLENEAENGRTKAVSGEDFVRGIQNLQERPRLIVLASCQSAGQGGDNDTFLAALGPRLAEAGVPAIIAMRGNISMETASKFMPAFFEALNGDQSPCAGQIDHAMTVARLKVRERPDFWIPMLFLRLKSGRIWYTPGFVGGDKGEGAKRWPAILSSIRDEECTVIAGHGLGDTLFGERSALAARIAKEYRFPLSQREEDSIEQVAQYVAVDQGAPELRKAFGRHLLGQCLSRHKDRLPDEIRKLDVAKAKTPEVFETLRLLTEQSFKLAGTSLVGEYEILARLTVPLYISTDPSDLLFEALKNAGRNPRRMLCPWNNFTEKLVANDKPEMGYQPTADAPLVYQLFGTLREPKSLLLTVDDYFDYLIGITSNKVLIPSAVRSALASTSLLFAGIRVEDWDFKMLLRTIVGQEGNLIGQEDVGDSEEDDDDDESLQHIAAQITPEEGRTGQPEKARDYLQTYLRKANINIYWGNSGDFLNDLMKRWSEKYGEEGLYGGPRNVEQ